MMAEPDQLCVYVEPDQLCGYVYVEPDQLSLNTLRICNGHGFVHSANEGSLITWLTYSYLGTALCKLRYLRPS